MLKVIKNIDPDIISSIDPKENIIFCIPYENNILNVSESFPFTYDIMFNNDINLSSNPVTKISDSILAFKYNPRIKISIPNGLMVNFTKFYTSSEFNIYQNIYKNITINNILNDQDIPTHNILSNIDFIIYIDMIRLKEEKLPLVIKKGTNITTMYFSWYMTKLPIKDIKNIYLIKNQQCYEDFMNIF